MIFGSFSCTPPPPTSLKHEFMVYREVLQRLVMKIKYVCHGLISLHFNFHDNRTKWTLTSNIKICRWGEKEKEPDFLILNSVINVFQKF